MGSRPLDPPQGCASVINQYFRLLLASGCLSVFLSLGFRNFLEVLKERVRRTFGYQHRSYLKSGNDFNTRVSFLIPQKLSNMKCDSNRFISASLPCNKHKNRLVHILPIESTRICLTPIRGVEGSDYINASLMDGYRQRGAYIATQGPLQDTTDDFWRMLWEHNSTIVVMLTKLKEMGRVSLLRVR